MRKIVFALSLMVATPVLGTTAGCNSAWWQSWSSNPVAIVQSFEQGVAIVLNAAQIAWAAIQPNLPPANAAAITQQYNNAVFAANHAIVVLNDAVTAAMAAQTPSPDFAMVMTAVTNAVAQVLAVVDQYLTNGPAAADAGAATSASNAATAMADAHAHLAKLQKMAAHQ